MIAPVVRTLDRVTVTPSTAVYVIPTAGTSAETVTLRIKNPSAKRLTFKIKTTQRNRFKVRHPFGFIEPRSTAKVRCTPRKLDLNNEFICKDHFTVLVAHASKKDKDAFSVWTEGSVGAGDVRNHKRRIVKIVYARKISKTKAKSSGVSLGGWTSQFWRKFMNKGDRSDSSASASLSDTETSTNATNTNYTTDSGEHDDHTTNTDTEDDTDDDTDDNADDTDGDTDDNSTISQ